MDHQYIQELHFDEVGILRFKLLLGSAELDNLMLFIYP